MYSYSTAGKELYITLIAPDHLNALHTCGDIIRGQVHFRPQSDKTIDELSVHLKCKLKNNISTGSGDNRRQYTAKAILVWEYKKFINTITPFPATPAGSNHRTWDFEFQFPWEVQANLPSTKPYQTHDEFEHWPGHALPPSYSISFGSDTQSVAYYLEAKIHKPNAIFKSTSKDKMLIQFSPSRAFPPPEMQPLRSTNHLSRSSRWLDPVKRNEKLSLGQKTKRIFSSEPDPTALFILEGHVPTVLCTDSPIPITLNFHHDLVNSTAPESPEVYIENVRARLTAFVSYRVPLGRGFRGSHTELVRHNDRKIELLNKTFSARPIYDGMQLLDLVPELSMANKAPPMFQTYGIKVYYKLKVSIILTCAKKSGEVVIANHGVTVLPGIQRSPPEDRIDSKMADLNTELPSYGESVAGPSSGMPAIQRASMTKEEEANAEAKQEQAKKEDTLPAYRETE